MNKVRLEYEIKSQGFTIQKFCEKVDISRSAFYRKSNGVTDFTQSEIQKIIDILEIQQPMDIFFDKKVSCETLLQ